MSASHHQTLNCRSVEIGVSDFTFSKSGRLVYCGNHEGEIVVWDALRAELIQRIQAHESRINSISASFAASVLLPARPPARLG